MCDDVGYNGQHGSVTRSDSRGVFMNSKQWATKNNLTSYGCRSLMRGVHHQSMTVFTSCWWFAGVKWYTLSTLVANQKRSRPLDSSCVRGSKLGTSRMGSNPLVQNPVPFLLNLYEARFYYIILKNTDLELRMISSISKTFGCLRKYSSSA